MWFSSCPLFISLCFLERTMESQTWQKYWNFPEIICIKSYKYWTFTGRKINWRYQIFFQKKNKNMRIKRKLYASYIYSCCNFTTLRTHIVNMKAKLVCKDLYAFLRKSCMAWCVFTVDCLGGRWNSYDNKYLVLA